MRGTVVFDIESHSADKLYSMAPEEFVRIAGYKWAGSDEVHLTTDLAELRDVLLSARYIIGHNIAAFDLRAVFGPGSDIPVQLADEGRVFDTWVHAVLVNPAPRLYENRDGKQALADSPAKMRKWFSLDEQAFQLGVSGKTDDLKALALEFGDASLAKKQRVDDGFGKIPVTDSRYREYLRGDVIASQAVAEALLSKGPFDDYAQREQRVAARAAKISSNGIRVDVGKAEARVATLAARRDEIMQGLVSSYGFPTEGAAPWATAAGKDAIFKALADVGITPESCPEWPLTATGNPSLGGAALVSLTAGTAAEELGTALAELKGQRSLAQLALDSVHPDGFAHPDITMLQRSGRWSTTDPGLTIWTARGDGAVEKEYFIPDADDEVLIELDYSNADARFVAAVSGDKRYAERFEPGADVHMINALAAWGKDVVATDPKGYRQKAKPLGHGWSYGGRAKTLAKQAGVPLADAESFVKGMDKTFNRLVSWQNKVRKEAQAGYVTNAWGRRMFVEKGREFTQGPALIGQNGTREIVCDALLRMEPRELRCVKAQVHDALLISVKKDVAEEAKKLFVGIMETSFKPTRGGQRINFPVASGPSGEDWYRASH